MQKATFHIGLKKFLWLKKVKILFGEHVISVLHEEEIVGMFYEEELHKNKPKRI